MPARQSGKRQKQDMLSAAYHAPRLGAELLCYPIWRGLCLNTGGGQHASR